MKIRNLHIACLQPAEDIKKNLPIQQTQECNCTLQEIHKQLQKSQGKQEINYLFHTKFRPGSNLLRKVGTTNFLCTGNEEFNGKQDVASSISLKTLHSFIDKQALLRVGGRLQQATLPYRIMQQIILPLNHHFTQSLVSAEDVSLHHAEPQFLIAFL